MKAPTRGACPPSRDIIAFADQRLAQERMGPIRHHLVACSVCQVLVAVAASQLEASAATGAGNLGVASGLPRRAFHKGLQLGRYRLERHIGSGAMGDVYLAADTELRREVAVKCVRSGLPGAVDRARVVREARAMARVDHPNVLPIYDVGTHDDLVYIVTQYAQRGALRGWLEAGTWRWQEVVDKFILAGRGLAAAHAAGLVHRDFKPDNVLLGDGGSVLVCDFGLVALQGALSLANDIAANHAVSTRDGAASADAESSIGHLVGTPAYMAPEQHLLRNDIGFAADQFAFCVSLWEALFGCRPFGGHTLDELTHAKLHGQRRPPPASHHVPAKLRALLERGLNPEPTLRYRDMETLVLRLEQLRENATPRRVMLALGFSAMVVGGALEHERDGCEAPSSASQLAWNEARAGAIRHAFNTSGSEHGREAADQVTRRLEAHHAASKRTLAELCAVREDGLDNDRRVHCLHRQQQQVSALLDVFEAATPTVVENALARVVELPAPRDCVEPEPGQVVLPSDRPDLPEALRPIPRLLDEAAALEFAGELAGAVEKSLAALHLAQHKGASPALLAETQVRYVEHLSDMAHDARFYALAEDAFFASEAAGQDTLVARAAKILSAELSNGGDLEQAEHWLQQAEIALHRSDERALELRVELAQAKAGLAYHRRDAAAALGHAEHALLLLRQGGERGESLAEALTVKALSLSANAQHEAANQALREALGIRMRYLFPDHMLILRMRYWIAEQYLELGDEERARIELEALLETQQAVGAGHDIFLADTLMRFAMLVPAPEAIPHLERALEIATRSQGEQHQDTAWAYYALATRLLELERTAEAVRLLERAAAIRVALVGPDHPDNAFELSQLALVDAEAGREEQALERARRALELRRTAYGEDHPYYAGALVVLGQVHNEAGRWAQACEVLEKALTHGDAGDAIASHARCLLALHEPAAAVEAIERVLADLQSTGHVQERALLEVRLARAYHQMGRDAAARELATVARDRVEDVSTKQARVIRSEAESIITDLRDG